MPLNEINISDLETLISERICIKIENWNLYLGDAGLARKLALECVKNLDKSLSEAVEISLSAIEVKIGDGSETIQLSKLISPIQFKELESILYDFT